jgi:hypothetical protein
MSLLLEQLKLFSCLKCKLIIVRHSLNSELKHIMVLDPTY